MDEIIMKDIYADVLSKINSLRQEIVNEIRCVLYSKRYGIGSTCYTPGTQDKFEIYYDRIIINEYHTDRISTDELLKYLRSAMHVIPKNI